MFGKLGIVGSFTLIAERLNQNGYVTYNIALWDRPHATDCNHCIFVSGSRCVCVCVLVGLDVLAAAKPEGLAAANLRFGSCRGSLGLGSCQTQVWQLPNSGSLGFGSCQTQVWHLPNSGSLGFGSCLTQVWQLPNSGSLGFGSCQTQVWQLPNSGSPGFGSCQTQVWQLPNSGLSCRTISISLFHTCHRLAPEIWA
jgi:hypothetical protein